MSKRVSKELPVVPHRTLENPTAGLSQSWLLKTPRKNGSACLKNLPSKQWRDTWLSGERRTARTVVESH